MCHSKPHPTLLTTDELLAECDARRLRRSGPGGQHRNKVETAVALVHRPTGVRAEANERRSQAQNRTVAVFRLRLKLALAVRAARDKHTAPSPLWRSRCHGGRIAVNPSHDDFPAMLAVTILAFPLMRFRYRLGRGEAAILVGIYLAYVASLVIWPSGFGS